MKQFTGLSSALAVVILLLAYTVTAVPQVGELEESDEFGRFLQESSASASGSGAGDTAIVLEQDANSSAMGTTFSLVALAAAVLLA